MQSVYENSDKKDKKNEYSEYVLKRAEIALSCSPFCILLFTDMIAKTVPISLIAGKNGMASGYTKKIISEIITDDELSWLIQVGLLRREVDGQGLTDSFRLTPLGRNVITKFKQTEGDFSNPDFLGRVNNFLARRLRLPF